MPASPPFSPADYKLGVPHDSPRPSFRFRDLLEGLTELRKGLSCSYSFLERNFFSSTGEFLLQRNSQIKGDMRSERPLSTGFSVPVDLGYVGVFTRLEVPRAPSRRGFY